MTAKIKIADLPEFDMTEHLDSNQAIAEYLTVILEDNDPALLAAALGDIARARGMTEIAKASGLTREALYKALRLAAWLGTSPDVWLGMQTQWDLWQAEQQPRPAIEPLKLGESAGL